MRKATLAVFLPAIFFLSPSFAQTSKKSATSTPSTASPQSSAAAPAAMLQGLDALADQAMKQWTVPGQPQYELAPTKRLWFDIKGLAGFSLDFQKDASGRIAEIVFNQPNGVFRAKRK